MSVQWINGNITPPEVGEYYTIVQATTDLIDIFECNKVVFPEKGIEITVDYWDSEQWESLGKENKMWKVLAWGSVLMPDVPNEYRDNLRKYMGRYCRWTGKTWEWGVKDCERICER